MFGIGLLSLFGAAVLAMSSDGQRPVLPLWPDGNPGGWTRTDTESSEVNSDKVLIVKGVSKPTLEIFKAPHAKPGAPTVLVCPGGGYWVLALDHEGWEIAKRLNDAGIHAAVLKYRLPNRDADKPLHGPSLQDAQRALRMLRFHANEYGFEADRIGIMGFSAGGHLSAVTSTTQEATYPAKDAADKLSFLPNFTLLIYPAYLNVPDTLKVAPEVAVHKGNPPVFIAQTLDDGIPIEGALAYTAACKPAGVSAELHVFPVGGHGYGLHSKEKGIQTWPTLMVDWINRLYSK